jgi:hypothetical protein
MFADLKDKINQMNDSELEALSLKETLDVSEALTEMVTGEPALGPNESNVDVGGDLNPHSNTVASMMSDFTSKFGIWSNDPGSDRNYLSQFSQEYLDNLNPDSKTGYNGALREKVSLEEHLLQGLTENGCDPCDDEDEEFTDGATYSEKDMGDLDDLDDLDDF